MRLEQNSYRDEGFFKNCPAAKPYDWGLFSDLEGEVWCKIRGLIFVDLVCSYDGNCSVGVLAPAFALEFSHFLYPTRG